MTITDAITAQPVVRDAQGGWTHPHFFTLTGVYTAGDFSRWLDRYGLESRACWMENEADDELLAAYDYQACCFADWRPHPPGEGWFAGSIHDTLAGPVCIWLRQAGGAVVIH